MRGMKAKEEYNSPFVEGGASMDPSFSKRGWGDLKTCCAISGLGGLNISVILMQYAG